MKDLFSPDVMRAGQVVRLRALLWPRLRSSITAMSPPVASRISIQRALCGAKEMVSLPTARKRPARPSESLQKSVLGEFPKATMTAAGAQDKEVKERRNGFAVRMK